MEVGGEREEEEVTYTGGIGCHQSFPLCLIFAHKEDERRGLMPALLLLLAPISTSVLQHFTPLKKKGRRRHNVKTRVRPNGMQKRSSNATPAVLCVQLLPTWMEEEVTGGGGAPASLPPPPWPAGVSRHQEKREGARKGGRERCSETPCRQRERGRKADSWKRRPRRRPDCGRWKREERRPRGMPDWLNGAEEGEDFYEQPCLLRLRG